MTTTRLGPHEVPAHPHVPACLTHACGTCGTCGKVHHAGGAECVACWVADRATRDTSTNERTPDD